MENYVKNDSYEEYVKNQTIYNKAKLSHVWVTGKEIEMIVNKIKAKNIDVKFGICHGVRNGYEVSEFRKLLKADIIGTEISDTATQFENVIEWDFHEIKDEWIGKFDFIYSNSIDHSYDFDHCLDQWMKTLSPNGACFIQWSSDIKKPHNKIDCFGIEKDSLLTLIGKKYSVIDIFLIPKELYNRHIIMIQHK